jgi:hypothetical protein
VLAQAALAHGQIDVTSRQLPIEVGYNNEESTKAMGAAACTQRQECYCAQIYDNGSRQTGPFVTMRIRAAAALLSCPILCGIIRERLPNALFALGKMLTTGLLCP